MNERIKLDELSINTIRFLAADAVQKANSGHPGAPMGDAVPAYMVWRNHLKHNPANPAWPGRDRFVLSHGHASMLLYSLLHLFGYELSLDDIKQFRQWASITPGHPEYGQTPGVEMTTGPLGQGMAHGVGLALAERIMAARFNKPGFEIIDNRTWALVSDGDLQEGISNEAASLAGFFGLGKLIYLYMDNDIQIEGSTDLTFTEDVAAKFRAYGWHVIDGIDGMSTGDVDKAIREACLCTDRPSLIICKTIIGYGSPKAGSEGSHGAPLGEDNVRLARENLGWPQQEFYVPDEVKSLAGETRDAGREAERKWDELFRAYKTEYPELARELEEIWRGELPSGWAEGLEDLREQLTDAMATRAASGKVLNHLATKIPLLLGGSADLGSSVKTVINGAADILNNSFEGRNIHYGVRENAMGAISGGLALYGGIVPYCSTFLIFSDYMRPPIRLAAMMKLRSLFVFSHDSIGVGEDGPTHQPIEQVMGLRSVPNLTVIRPANGPETVEAWRAAIGNAKGPTALILTRQKLAGLEAAEAAKAEGLHKGAYVFREFGGGQPDLIFIASGSELALAAEAGKKLADNGYSVRVVSMPSWSLFEKQSEEYRKSVLPPSVKKRISVEAGTTLGWERYVGDNGVCIGINRFGQSAPSSVLFEQFGFTVENVLRQAEALLTR